MLGKLVIFDEYVVGSGNILVLLIVLLLILL